MIGLLLVVCVVLGAISGDCMYAELRAPRKLPVDADDGIVQERAQRAALSRGTAVPADIQFIADLTSDLELRMQLLDAVAAAGGEGVSACEFKFVECHGQTMVGLSLVNITGTIAVDRLKLPIERVSVANSHLTQPLKLEDVPRTLRSIAFRSVRFQTGRRPVLTFPTHRATLRSFTCSDCDIASVEWSNLPMLEHLDLSVNPGIARIEPEALPLSLQHLNLSHCSIGIDADFPKLPPMLKSLDLTGNRLRGPLPCAHGWDNIEVFRVGGNQLSGRLCRDGLPPTLTVLDVHNNRLEGPVPDFRDLEALQELNLAGNVLDQFSGWDLLPPDLEVLELGGNRIVRMPPIATMPRTLVSVNVSRNAIDGRVDLSDLPKSLQSLDVSHNRFSGGVDLTNLPSSMGALHLEHNAFTGSIDLTKLPLELRRVVFHSNDFDVPLPPEFAGL